MSEQKATDRTCYVVIPCGSIDTAVGIAGEVSRLGYNSRVLTAGVDPAVVARSREFPASREEIDRSRLAYVLFSAWWGDDSDLVPFERWCKNAPSRREEWERVSSAALSYTGKYVRVVARLVAAARAILADWDDRDHSEGVDIHESGRMNALRSALEGRQ